MAQTRVRRRIFFVFSHMVGSQVMKSTTKNQFCHVSLIRLLVKFVVLQSHSQSICVLNQCHIKINTHLVSHIETFCLFPLIFYPHEICLIVAFVFIQLTCNNTIRSVCLSERREWKAKHFFHTQKRTYNPQSTKKQILLTVSNLSLKHMKFA